MIRHSVVFRLRRPIEQEAVDEFVERLEAFAQVAVHASGPVEVRRALMLRGEGPRAAEALLEADFHDADAFASYIASDVHQAFVREVLEPLCEGWWSTQTDRDAR